MHTPVTVGRSVHTVLGVLSYQCSVEITHPPNTANQIVHQFAAIHTVHVHVYNNDICGKNTTAYLTSTITKFNHIVTSITSTSHSQYNHFIRLAISSQATTIVHRWAIV